MNTGMRIEHVAVWTRDLDRLRDFHVRWFGATANARYDSRTTPGLATHFLTYPGGGPRLEVMTLPALADGAPHPATGWAHLAVQVASPEAVRALVEAMRAAGVPIVSAPRTTGDGYYEAVIADPDGNRIEITA